MRRITFKDALWLTVLFVPIAILISLFALLFSVTARADTVSCPDNALVNKEVLARVKQHDADVAVAHARAISEDGKPLPQPTVADLKASIERLKKYPGDLKEVSKYCSVKKVVK